MKTRLLLCLPALLASVLVGRGDPVSLTRSEAFELHDALTKLAPGLSPENTFLAADDINALETTARTYRQMFSKLVQLERTTNAAPTPEAVARFRDEDAKVSAASEEKKVYDLTPLIISKDEVKAAGISANILATIRRLLSPSTPKTK